MKVTAIFLLVKFYKKKAKKEYFFQITVTSLFVLKMFEVKCNVILVFVNASWWLSAVSLPRKSPTGLFQLVYF